MSGLAEISQWVRDNIDLKKFDNVEDAYKELNITEDWRNDLDDILLDQKSKFLDFLETQISPKQIEPPEGSILIRAYSYLRKGKLIKVPSHFRRKVKR